MWLVIGLGNPSEEYQNTRHNAGFQVLDFFAKFLGKEGDFLGWKKEKMVHSELGRGSYKNRAFILAKPDTFMNKSGQAVKALLKKYKTDVEHLIIIHDDIDITIGSYKIQKNRGAAGHRGVQSVINTLGTKDFWRVRVGIRPERGKPSDTTKFVTANWTTKEKETLFRLIVEIVEKQLPKFFNKI